MSCIKHFNPISPNAQKLIHFRFPKLLDYKTGNTVQQHLLKRHLDFKRLNGPKASLNSPQIALSFEFNNVYTGGKREAHPSRATKLPPLSFPLIQTDRGGQITYHGPGQLVCYFIWDLFNWSNLSSRCFVSMLENSLVTSVESTGLQGVCKTKDTGVWVQKGLGFEKICSLGLNIKRNITSHGISMNVSPQLKYLNNPELVICGLEGKSQTSLEHCGITKVSVDDMAFITVSKIAQRMTQHMQDAKMEVTDYVVESKNVDDIIHEIDSFLHACV